MRMQVPSLSCIFSLSPSLLPSTVNIMLLTRHKDISKDDFKRTPQSNGNSLQQIILILFESYHRQESFCYFNIKLPFL